MKVNKEKNDPYMLTVYIELSLFKELEKVKNELTDDTIDGKWNLSKVVRKALNEFVDNHKAKNEGAKK